MRFPILLVISGYLFLLLTDIVILSDLGFSLKNFKDSLRKRRIVAYGIFSILILAVFTVAVCLPKKSAGMDITAIMWLVYIVLTVIISQFFYCIFSWIGKIPQIFGKKKWKTGLFVGLPMAIFIFLMLWYGAFIGRYKIETSYVEISSPRLPESFEGYRIAQISDIHVGTWGNDTTFISELVDSIMALKPDMIVFTGDAVNRMSDEFNPFVKPLARLKAPDGVFSILGNHDYGDYMQWNSQEEKKQNLDSLKAYQAAAGWRLMDNVHSSIYNEAGDSIILIGVGNWGEPPFSQYGDLDRAYQGKDLNDENFKILLSHNPKHWDEIVSNESNIDLTLSGHTHAMQMMIDLFGMKWSPAKLKYDQWRGLYNRLNDRGDITNVYVNIGAGEVGLPMRVGATPEITLFTLKKSK